MSLKILVNNEEVVCNNNLQIKEEMLSTSSTILKNCYPKTWEATKDYVSNYYFPKDYSKCKIIEETEINYEIVGSTTQDGTPTPASPIPMVSKAGNITETIEGIQYNFSLGDVELCKVGNYEDKIYKSSGKNLYNTAVSTSKDGIEITGNGNYVNINGIATASDNKIDIGSAVLPAGTYTITNEYLEGNAYVSGWLYYKGTWDRPTTYSLAVNNIKKKEKTTFTLTEQREVCFALYYTSGTDYQNCKIRLQIEKGSTSSNYEPYGSYGEWYLAKNTRKVELAVADMDNSEAYPGWTNVSQIKQDYPYQNAQFTSKSSVINNIHGTSTTFGINTNSSNATVWIYRTVFDYSQTDWMTNYPDLVISMIYGLQIPDITKITNPTLLEQLESVGQKLLFCGCVKNTGNINLSPTEPHFVDLQVLDFKTLLSEGETLNYVITGKTIVEAINQVVNSISDYGFIVGNIQILNPNDVINAYSTLDKTPYDVFQYIADITQSRWTTRMVDENTVAIDFYDPTLMPEADPIENTHEYMCQNKIDDISFSYSTNDYRNKQIMTSDEIIANITQTETIVADGYATSFMCQNKIGTITNMKVNGVNATFITKNEEELGLTATFVYQPGNSSFESSSTILSGSVITITYYPIVKGREIILNSGESTRISTQIGRNGNISRYENRQDATSSAELQKIGQSYIKYKGKAQINLKVKTEKDLFDVGQIVEYQAPLEELSTDYMVKSKTIDWYVNVDKTFYTYELTSNYNYEDAINFFDNQRAKSKGNIGEGQTISRNIDLESTALILFYDTDVEEVEILNPTSLDFALDGVII